MENVGSALTIIIAALALFIIFMLLREVMCWYYKINQRVALHEEQIELQKETIELLKMVVKTRDYPSSVKSILEISNESSLKTKNPDSLTAEESDIVAKMVPQLRLTEVIVLNTVSRIIKRMYKSEFKEGSNWIIVKEYESKII